MLFTLVFPSYGILPAVVTVNLLTLAVSTSQATLLVRRVITFLMLLYSSFVFVQWFRQSKLLKLQKERQNDLNHQ